MMKTAKRTVGAVWLALVSVALLQAQTQDLPTRDLQGAWRQADGDAILNFKGDQLFSWTGGKLSIFGVVHRRTESVVLRNAGVLETWQASLKDGVLRLGRNGEIKPYRRLPSIPAEVDLQPFTVGTSSPLPAGRVQAIQKEIAERFQQEQEVLKAGIKDPAQAAKAQGLREDNLRYLTSLAKEVGWPDALRFGEKASVDATLMLKHTGNLPLMLAVLPQVEKDLKFAGDGQTYAVLYDDLQLQLGKKQRYGTQIGEDAKGNPYVLPLENPQKVDEYLKEMGVPPLASYLAEISKVYYDGKKNVRLATQEESE